MRILFVNNYYPPHEVGGYEQLCRDMVVALTARGHACAVITSTHGVTAATPAQPEVHRVLRIQPDYGSRLHPALQFMFTRAALEKHNLDQFHQVCAAFHPEVVFIWNVCGLPRSLCLAAEALPDAVVAYWLAGYSPADPDEYWQYWQTQLGQRPAQVILRRCLGPWALRKMRREGKPLRPRMAHVAVVSDGTRREGLAAGSLPAHTRVLYNGVETDLFWAERSGIAQPLRLLFAGRMSEDKGPQVAIAALGHLVNDAGITAVSLTLVGDGPQRQMSRLKELVEELRLQPYVTFLGWQPRDRMPAIMREHDVLLFCTSGVEAFARVVLEAMASGQVVIGTLTGGTGEVLVEGVTGLTYQAGDSSELARQIMRLVHEPALWESLSRTGQRVACERYSMDRMVDEIEAFLQEALDAGHDSHPNSMPARG